MEGAPTDWTTSYETRLVDLAIDTFWTSACNGRARIDAMPQTLKGTVEVEISAGDLIDKLTILQIKAERIGDPDKRANVRIALQHLSRVRDEALSRSDELARLEESLKACNEKLWDIEDEIRNCEAAKEFGPRFSELARAVY